MVCFIWWPNGSSPMYFMLCHSCFITFYQNNFLRDTILSLALLFLNIHKIYFVTYLNHCLLELLFMFNKRKNPMKLRYTHRWNKGTNKCIKLKWMNTTEPNKENLVYKIKIKTMYLKYFSTFVQYFYNITILSCLDQHNKKSEKS